LSYGLEVTDVPVVWEASRFRTSKLLDISFKCYVLTLFNIVRWFLLPFNACVSGHSTIKRRNFVCLRRPSDQEPVLYDYGIIPSLIDGDTPADEGKGSR
jgi:hypothetical protein